MNNNQNIRTVNKEVIMERAMEIKFRTRVERKGRRKGKERVGRSKWKSERF